MEHPASWPHLWSQEDAFLTTGTSDLVIWQVPPKGEDEAVYQILLQGSLQC